MSDTTPSSQPRKSRNAVSIGLALSAAWLVLVVAFFLLAGRGEGEGLSILPAVMIVIAVVGPIALIASVSVALAMVTQAAQVRALRAELTAHRASVTPVPGPDPDLKADVQALGGSLDEIRARLDELEMWLAERAHLIEAMASRPDPVDERRADHANGQDADIADAPDPVQTDESEAEKTPELGLTSPSEGPNVPLDTFIRALEFPSDQHDAEGFDALRVALRDHRAAQLVTAAQDVLTLLSQDGLYMDDLTPDRASVELWRRFAQGERGAAVARVGGIRDEEAEDLCVARMRQDTIFRDAVHHFLRLFDHTFADLEPGATDAQVAAWSETRSARAFMLLGRAAGIFHD
ncbi:hypothetical protein ILP92_01030 [Maribius pontilimi]|uniref:Uncharacterized protein n=1 Tax=Palleronia pontilimi TaxID=1964209 RepID=A0A934ID59_9RHOB|nr:hypothetical protein [Palleronia pontilimi]MBJ3761335.1 hypothetical protein [Palleronia pontilimi]